MRSIDKGPQAPPVVTAADVVMRMKLDYSRGVRDQTMRCLETVSRLCWEFERPDLDSRSFMKEIVDAILKIFAIESVGIGVRDPVDRLYRYKIVGGLDKTIEDGYLKLSYTKEQLLEPTTYPAYEISKHTRLLLAEDHPYGDGEEFTYRRPGLLGMKRRSVTDSLEADYLDILFYDTSGDVLGFIEISGTRMRKLPDASTIKWVELLAALLGIVIQKERGA